MSITDFHVHAFPSPFDAIALGPLTQSIAQARRRLRDWMRPYTNSIHKTQTVLRWVPGKARDRLDAMGALAPGPHLMLESTLEDLTEAMSRSGVGRAVLIAHPPLISNDFVLEAAASTPGIVAAVNIPPGTDAPDQVLKKYVERGARILKIHPAADGEGVDSPRYRLLLRTAADLGLPVILHTGCIHSHVLYKDPMEGEAQRFTPWFREFPGIRFVLAHMNFHEPQVALDLCEEFSHLWVDTSWQPAEIIGEAVRRVGAGRVLFGSDWPLVGNNMAVGLSRIDDAVSSAMISSADRDAILAGNAEKLLPP